MFFGPKSHKCEVISRIYFSKHSFCLETIRKLEKISSIGSWVLENTVNYKGLYIISYWKRLYVLGWFKNPVSSQTEKLMAATKFSDYLGLNHYKKAKKLKHFIHLRLANRPQSFAT